MNIEQAYRILGLKQGTDWEHIRKKHRALVKKYHPDLAQTEEEQRIAHDTIIEINKAYAYLRRVKQRAGFSTKPKENITSTPFSFTEIRFTVNTETSSPKYSKPSSTTKSSAAPTFEQKKIDRILSNWAKKRNAKKIDGHRKKTEYYYKKQIEEKREYWLKLRTKYDERTRLGLYRSFLNAIIFGKFYYFRQETTSTSLSGKVSLQDKYEIDLRHHLIQDKVFYAVNNSANVTLKYLFGGLYVVMFIYFILLHYGYGRLSDSTEFVQLQLFVLSQFAILFLPDNLFQRGLLWRFRHLEKSSISKTFENNTLPGKYSIYLFYLLLGKFGILFLSIVGFFWVR